MAKAEQIIQLLQHPIEQAGYGLWDVEYQKEGGKWFLRLFINHSQGITLDDCVKVNEVVIPILEIKDLIPQEYILEVSSPGIYRSLKKAEHFRQSIGETIQIKLFKAIAGQKQHRGQLVTATNQGFEVLLENQEHLVLSYQQVAKAQMEA